MSYIEYIFLKYDLQMMQNKYEYHELTYIYIRSKSGYFTHRVKVHGGENMVNKVECLQCGKMFKDTHQLRQHRAKHSGIDQFI